jgi:hypothetical protein
VFGEGWSGSYILLLLVCSLNLSYPLNSNIFVSFPIPVSNRLEKLDRVFYGVELGMSSSSI